MGKVAWRGSVKLKPSSGEFLIWVKFGLTLGVAFVLTWFGVTGGFCKTICGCQQFVDVNNSMMSATPLWATQSVPWFFIARKKSRLEMRFGYAKLMVIKMAKTQNRTLRIFHKFQISKNQWFPKISKDFKFLKNLFNIFQTCLFKENRFLSSIKRVFENRT